MNASASIPFEAEARDLAHDEHFVLTRRFEEIAMEYGEAEAWRQLDGNHGYCTDPADYFEQHRASFLEQAREEFAEAV